MNRLRVSHVLALIAASFACDGGFFSATNSSTLHAATIGFTFFNADGDDDFAVVVLEDILVSEDIFFTDNEIDGLGIPTAGEGFLKWTTGPISAGEVVVFSDVDNPLPVNPGFGASKGDLLAVGIGDFNLTGGGDGLYAYQGTTELMPSDFLAAVANDSFGGSLIGSLSGTGLTEGVDAVAFSSVNDDGGAYIGPRTGQSPLTDFLALTNNSAHWTVNEFDGEALLLSLDTTMFLAIPEPVTALIALSGILALLSLRSRNN